MMEAMRERTLVGLFVLIAGGLLFGTMLALSGGMGSATVSHRAYFKFAGGVQAGRAGALRRHERWAR